MSVKHPEIIESIMGVPFERRLDTLKKFKIQNISSNTKKRNTRKTKRISKRELAWQFFKGVLFITCTASFLYQAASFCREYYTYPTTTTIAVTSPKVFMKPAVTVCNPNPVPRSVFCSENLHLCQTPSNLPEFCGKHPYFCKGNVSNLLIPKLGYYASDMTMDVRAAASRYLFDANVTIHSFFLSFFSLNTDRQFHIIKKLFTKDFSGMTDMICYSINLQLCTDLEPDAATIDIYANEKDPVRATQFYHFDLNVKEDEMFYPWTTPEVFLSVHSPFVPVNPYYKGESLTTGNIFRISVSLEEHHLLPYPYQTDCIDYDALWRKNNRTGPRSQEMCKELCNLSFSKECYGCSKNLLIYEIASEWCPFDHDTQCENLEQLREINLRCKESCKIECVKLKFSYEVKKIRPSDLPFWLIRPFSYKDHMFVYVIAQDLDVVQIRHNPLYSNEDLFSFVGGLMGCWLGISVFTFLGIIENVLETAIRFMETLRRKQRSSVEGVVSFIKY